MDRFLRTETPDGDWRSFKFTNNATYNMRSGLLYLVQETVGVAFVHQKLNAQGCAVTRNIEPAEEGVLIYHAEKIEVEKVAQSGHDFLPGDKVYWPGTPGAGVTPVYQSGYYWIGIAVKASGGDEETVVIDLKGDKATLTDPL